MDSATGRVAGVVDEGPAPPVAADRGERLYLVGGPYGPVGGRQRLVGHPGRRRPAQVRTGVLGGLPALLALVLLEEIPRVRARATTVPPVTRGGCWFLAICGGVLAVVGVILDATQASTESHCSVTVPTLLGIPGSPPAATCDQANTLTAVGDGLIAVGLILIIVGIVLAVRKGQSARRP